MADRVEHRHGCNTGCLPTIAILAVVMMAYEYWYVTVPVLLAVGAVALYVNREKIAGWADESSPEEAPATAPATEGRWDIDPINAQRERWREGDRWTDATRRREDWLPGEQGDAD